MMQTALRKMGNSTGMIVPKSILGEIGITTGATLDLKVENGRLIATPVSAQVRVGWAESAATLGEPTVEERDWMSFGNEDDASLTW